MGFFTVMCFQLAWIMYVLFAHLFLATEGVPSNDRSPAYHSRHLKNCHRNDQLAPVLGYHASAESILTEVLLDRYKLHNRHLVRPVMNASHAIWVKYGLGLIQILDFSEKDQMLKTQVWKKYYWKDEFLTWDPADYEGVKQVLIHSSKLWIPDIMLYNNGGETKVEDHSGHLVIDSNGGITWIPTVRYLSSCTVDMTNFPFDEQTCHFKFGSWTYSASKLDMAFIDETENVDVSNYVINSEWDVIKNEGKRVEIKYDCCEEVYTTMTFTLTFKRQVTLHMRLILIPTMMLTLLSCAIFWIPPNRPDRTTLGLSLFSAFFLLLILVLTNSPPVKESKLGHYYVIVILLVSFGVLYSVIIINISLKESRPPKFIDKFLVSFSCCLCRDASIRDERKPLDDLNGTSLLSHKGRGAVADTFAKSSSLDKYKWQKFALIIDRFVFIIFLGCIIISFITVFPCPMSIFFL